MTESMISQLNSNVDCVVRGGSAHSRREEGPIAIAVWTGERFNNERSEFALRLSRSKGDRLRDFDVTDRCFEQNYSDVRRTPSSVLEH